MKNRSILLFITTSCLGVVSARAQSSFPNGFSIGSPVDAQCVSWDNEVGIGRTTSFGSENGGLTLYSNVKETSKAAWDGGITLFGNPLTFVPQSSPDWSGGTFDVWNGDTYGASGGTPVFRIDTVADKATFDTLDVDITNGTLSVAGSPVMTSDNAGSFLVNQGFLQHSSGGGLVLSGTHGGSAIPATGAGTRMMWYPGKSAFRAGAVTSDQWDDANVGVCSTAMGYNTRASGRYSTAMGEHTVASGDNSTAMGSGTIAVGFGSTAMGKATKASGAYSLASGDNVVAPTYAGTALGTYNEERRGNAPFNSYYWHGTDEYAVLEVGIGTSSTNRQNALTILQDGSVELGKATQTDDSVPLIIKSDGSVILAKAQGDISMGIYGN